MKHSEPVRNPDQLRDRIDHGKTGDKVDFPDPAAAPLGTDDEAAGQPLKTLPDGPRPPQTNAPIEAGSRKDRFGGRVVALVLSVTVVTALAMIATLLV